MKSFVYVHKSPRSASYEPLGGLADTATLKLLLSDRDDINVIFLERDYLESVSRLMSNDDNISEECYSALRKEKIIRCIGDN